MSQQKKSDAGNVDIHIQGDVGNQALIGNFANNKGDINSNNTNTANSSKHETKEQRFLQLSKELLQLLQKDQQVDVEEKEELTEWIETNQDLIKAGKVRKATLLTLKDRLLQLKKKVNQPSPLLQNAGSLAEIIGLFFPS